MSLNFIIRIQKKLEKGLDVFQNRFGKVRPFREFSPKSLGFHPQLPCFSPRSLVAIKSELSMSTVVGHPYHEAPRDAKHLVVKGH